MKRFYAILCMSILVIGCQPPPDNSANEAYEKNSKTVLAYLEGIEKESIDYSAMFADNFISRGTTYGAPDSTTLDQMIEGHKDLWARFDLELLPKPIVLLPGVNVDTKKVDGSVRYYGTWNITVAATDSTEAKTGELNAYESFDFNEEGEIIFMQFYADVTGVMMYLGSNE